MVGSATHLRFPIGGERARDFRVVEIDDVPRGETGCAIRGFTVV